jgi:hypothetical protein
MSNNVVETDGAQMTSQYGAYALHTELARLHARMRMHTSTRSGTHMEARTYTHTHTHKAISNTYCFSTASGFASYFISSLTPLFCFVFGEVLISHLAEYVLCPVGVVELLNVLLFQY